MTLTAIQDQAAIIEMLAREAGALAMTHFETLATVPVESKGHLDLVTAAHPEVERFVTERFNSDRGAVYRGLRFVGALDTGEL